MVKLAVFFVAALAFQATFAFPKYFEEGKLVNYLDEIHTEVKDLTLFLNKDFPTSNLAVKTITWQCRELSLVVEQIITKLSEEIFTSHEEGQEIFKQVTFMLKEIHSSLKKMAVYTEMSDLHEVKKHFIVCIESVFENIDKLVRLTYTVYPEFRFTLKYLLVDFMTTLNHIRSHFKYLTMTTDVEFTPKHMVMKIHEYTRECTEILKEFNHPMQMKVALRGYLRYVREIVYHLEKQTIKGEKEFDLLMHQLTNKLREIVFPLMELTMTNEMFDMKVFRTEIVHHLFEVIGIYEQLIQWCETKHIPVDVKYFIEKVMFYYLYAIKQVTYEIKFGYKLDFYMPEYYTTSFYGKYGYGLYEPIFRDHFMTYDMGMYTLFPMNKYFMGKYEKMYTPMDKMNFDMEYYNKHGMDFYTPKYEKHSYTHKYGMEFYTPKYEKDFFTTKYEKEFYTPKYEKDFYTTKYEKDLYTPKYEMEFYSPKYGMEKYYKGMTYEHQTPKELVMHIQMLVKRVFDEFEYKTMDVKDVKESTLYYIREFLTCIDIIYNKFESVSYTDKIVKEFLMNLKETKMQLEKMMTMRMFYNIHEIRMYLVRSIKMVATDLYKMVMIEKFEHIDYEFFHKICVVYMNFLNKFHTKYTVYDHEYSMYDMPKTVFSGLKTHKELLMRMHMLTKKIFEHYQYKTVGMKSTPIFYIRHFLTVLDYVMEKMTEKMTMEYYGEKKVMNEVYTNLKQIKYELERYIHFGMYTNMNKMTVHFVDYLKIFTIQMEKLVMMEEYSVIMKDICIRYVNFLEKFFLELNKYSMEYPMYHMDTMYHDTKMESMTPFYYTRQMKY